MNKTFESPQIVMLAEHCGQGRKIHVSNTYLFQ